MPRVLAASALALWAGTTLLLSELRWFQRPSLVDRLRPYAPGAGAGGRRHRPGLLSAASFRDLAGPAARSIGARLAGALGVTEDIATRLERVGSPLDPTAFRLRQLGWAGASLSMGAVVAVAFQPPLPVALLLVAGSPMLAFLVMEQQLAAESERWKRRVLLELPVVSEQLGMLLGAGYSLGGAMNRIAARGSGACARGFANVGSRVRQGLSEIEALREWATVADVEALHRLVAVLAMNRETGDLGRLVAAEARSIRRHVQRQLVEQMERRSQQVWIPVTVATLVPGAVLIAIPFVEALRLFSES